MNKEVIKFKKNLEKAGVTEEDFCKEMKLSFESYKVMTYSKEAPRWVKAFNYKR